VKKHYVEFHIAPLMRRPGICGVAARIGVIVVARGGVMV